MTLDELYSSLLTLLTRVGSNRISGPDILTACQNIVGYFATQIATIIPLWEDDLTFQQDGSDDGRFCRYADTNGKIRLFETKVDDNINNVPPTNPATTENSFWREVSASASAAIPEWAAGVYGPGLIIVYHNHSVDGKGLYVLVDPARPYTSTNIETEITALDWERITGSELITVSTAGGTINYEFNNTPERSFQGSAAITTPKTIAFLNSTKGKEFQAFHNITDVAAVLTFPASVKMSSGLWLDGPKTWTPEYTGEYKFIGHFNGTTWYVDAYGPY
ncbi:MAG TPA: hypothetical protein VK589_24330 [Chryseolinea sp.]|nr:hypothetical protein [Chryseolinea sp.]